MQLQNQPNIFIVKMTHLPKDDIFLLKVNKLKINYKIIYTK